MFPIMYPVLRLKRLVQQSYSDLKEGDWTRINRHARKKIKYVKSSLSIKHLFSIKRLKMQRRSLSDWD